MASNSGNTSALFGSSNKGKGKVTTSPSVFASFEHTLSGWKQILISSSAKEVPRTPINGTKGSASANPTRPQEFIHFTNDIPTSIMSFNISRLRISYFVPNSIEILCPEPSDRAHNPPDGPWDWEINDGHEEEKNCLEGNFYSASYHIIKTSITTIYCVEYSNNSSTVLYGQIRLSSRTSKAVEKDVTKSCAVSCHVEYTQAAQEVLEHFPQLYLNYDIFELYAEEATTDQVDDAREQFEAPQTSHNLFVKVLPKDEEEEAEGTDQPH
ncbi:hypothetical protein ACH5RR_029475 [Cinchona calisaya]|uniref:Uncharacterized protein n=1 Tax=Cinchona calisaya TaxID=153742 RepID=A0ABD2YRR5_9GENT